MNIPFWNYVVCWFIPPLPVEFCFVFRFLINFLFFVLFCSWLLFSFFFFLFLRLALLDIQCLLAIVSAPGQFCFLLIKFHFEFHLSSFLSNIVYGLLWVLTLYHWFIEDSWCLPTHRRYWETAARTCVGMCHDMPEGQIPSQSLVRLILPAFCLFLYFLSFPSKILQMLLRIILVLFWNHFQPLF